MVNCKDKNNAELFQDDVDYISGHSTNKIYYSSDQ